jgi:hypothetical protein
MEFKFKNGKYFYIDKIGREYEVDINDCGGKTDAHYNNTHGSLYKFAEEYGLNSYEFTYLSESQDVARRVNSRRT